jgi:3D (Asp-Asp-Asp) domain-containing protein
MTLDEYSSRLPKYLTLFQGLVLGIYILSFPVLAIADSSASYAPESNVTIIDEPLNNSEINVSLADENASITVKTAEDISPKLVPAKPKPVLATSKRVITAYNSEVAQCDDSPCITANGFNVCEHGVEDTIAANFLKFGTKVKIPDLFGDRVFIVRDRMNPKHDNRVDIWMKEKVDAKQFGVKLARIEVVE